ncbi:dolichyl-phosphate-mannose--protein mannosyltransferase [Paenibacillus psychroresistens]|uniref:Dolichyl-phosphate-mannose--protein mannosyltransferase n=1 Tax=Paenibacillus psychroresistens TaxID=1778678 RepID=A0A6B8RR70_9BACL|nr:glycosyltransferase family 39 protein [Paenibacillus psychroresistens]QGQ97983.1 dolichyl-phosphate-mannose--protein mannosyltransferase [Paenibacillus psychroresistens]
MFSMLEESRRTKLWLAIMMAFVFVASLSIVLFYGDHFLLGTYEKLNNDDVKYVNSAKILLNYHTLAYNSGTKPTAFIMPGVPLILSGLMLIFGQNDTAVMAYRVLQATLQSGSIFLLFVLARYVLNSRIAMIVCAISCFYLPDYFTAGVILSEAWFKTIFMLLLTFTIVAIEKRQLRYYIIVAVFLAMACYFKPQAVLYPIVFAIPWFMHKYSWKQMISFTMVIIVTFCLLLTPWWVRNYESFGKWIPFTNSAGSPFLQGALIFDKLPSDGFFVQYPQYTPKNILLGSEEAKVVTAKRILYYGLTHEPLKYLAWHTVIKTALLYIAPFYWKPILGIHYPVMITFQIIMFFMAIMGIVLSFIQKKAKKLVILLAFSYFTLIYLPFVTFDRYGYPNHFILLIFAAFCGERLFSNYKTRRNLHQSLRQARGEA